MSVLSRIEKLKAEKKAKAEADARIAEADAQTDAKKKAKLEKIVKRILKECKGKDIKQNESNLTKDGYCILRLKVCRTEQESYTGDDSRGELYYDWEVLMWDRRSVAFNDHYGKRLGTNIERIEEEVAKVMAEYL